MSETQTSLTIGF